MKNPQLSDDEMPITVKMPADWPETHKQGLISIENLDMIVKMKNDGELMDADFGVQISRDGRVWCCINGIAFIRFKPAKSNL